MRISDWSSDVCSSDLDRRGRRGNGGRPVSPDQFRGRLWAVVPAAGRGARFGGDVPKQYLDVAGEPLLAHALRALLAHPKVNGAVVVLAEGDTRWPGWAEFEGKSVQTCVGGGARADSRSEEHTSELQSLMRISYAVFCL